MAGFFEDQKGSASSKRAITYIFTFFYFLQVNASIAGKEIDQNVVYTTVAIILFGLGVITSEYIKEILPMTEKKDKDVKK
jgi:hypothetical protein